MKKSYILILNILLTYITFSYSTSFTFLKDLANNFLIADGMYIDISNAILQR